VPTTRKTLSLPDGRELQVLVTPAGDSTAPTLVFHHGTPGSAFQPRYLAAAAARAGVHLVTFSRPGYAGSTRRPGRSVADVVPDVVAVLDDLGVSRALVAGWSGGGPHALACGALLPERVGAVLSIASVGPYGGDGLDFLAGMGDDNVDEFGAALRGESELRRWLEAHAPELRAATPEQVVAALRTLLPPVDVGVLTGELGADVGEDMAEGMHSALSSGIDGWLDDDLAFTKPWGFGLGDIAVPVTLWQGSDDLMVPFAHGEWLVRRVPGVRAHLEAGQGHLSIGIAAMDQMLAELRALAGLPAS
jgi:pimeloyl-ACP methyl ester carboxylesterase